MTNQDFDRCMQRMGAGDRDALKEIYEEYLGYVFSMIMGILRSREDAEDLSADLFVKLFTSAGSWRPGGGHKAYMGTMARNLAIDHLRKTGKMNTFGSLDIEQEQQEILLHNENSEMCSAEDEVLSQMSFREAVDSLPEQARSIVTMKVLGGMTFREIAQVLQIPMGTVTWRYQDSMKRLRRAAV